MTNEQKIEGFKAAKKIALSIKKGCQRRAIVDNFTVNYTGLKDLNGRMWVIGDTGADLQNPDAFINGFPAREVFGEFSVMYK